MVRKIDQKKYTLQLNTRHKLHLCREALVTALIVLPLENTVKPHKWKPLVIQLQLFYSWLLWHVLPLPEPSVSCLESKPPSAALLPPTQSIRMYTQLNKWTVLQVTQLKTNSGHLNAFGEKEGMKQVSTCTRGHRHFVCFLNTLAIASTSEKNAHLNEEQHTGIHDLAASHVLKTQRAMRCDELNLMKKIQSV